MSCHCRFLHAQQHHYRLGQLVLLGFGTLEPEILFSRGSSTRGDYATRDLEVTDWVKRDLISFGDCMHSLPIVSGSETAWDCAHELEGDSMLVVVVVGESKFSRDLSFLSRICHKYIIFSPALPLVITGPCLATNRCRQSQIHPNFWTAHGPTLEVQKAMLRAYERCANRLLKGVLKRHLIILSLVLATCSLLARLKELEKILLLNQIQYTSALMPYGCLWSKMTLQSPSW